MRQIGKLPLDVNPKVFIDHLLTLGVTTRVIQGADGWDIWVHHEDRVPLARQELEAYLQNPRDPSFQAAVQSAEAIRREQQRLDRQYHKNVRDLSSHWDTTNLRRRPCTVALIAVSAVVFVLMQTSYGVRVITTLSFSGLGWDHEGALVLTGLRNILHGEVWRLITPIFLHFGFLHILFNMWMLFSLGSLIEIRRNTRTMVLLVLACAVISNLGQYGFDVNYGAGPTLFGGMSGVVYGLFGYIWMKGRYEPEQGMMADSRLIQTMLFWLVLCFSGMIGPIANGAHLIGLLAGMFLGRARL